MSFEMNMALLYFGDDNNSAVIKNLKNHYCAIITTGQILH
jgi:hypothetical protein